MYREKNKYDLIVIGGGASGMMCAGRAAELGARVLLLEKNKVLGKKLSVTGGGRCNITNAEDNVRTFLENFPVAKEFLFSPFSKFSSKDTFTFFEGLGLPLVTEARKRAFPKTQNANDVTKTMEKYIRKNGVEIQLGTSIVSLSTKDGNIVSVISKKGEVFTANNFAIATGGMAAPETGSTGDGFSILEKIGHTIKKPSPNIVPLTTDESWVHKLSGVTLSFMAVRFRVNGKTKLKKTGKILFTHFGISGPLILNSALEVQNLMQEGDVNASVDMFPDTDIGSLDKRVQKLFDKNINKQIKNVLPEIIPQKIAEVLLEFVGPDLNKRKINSITKEERKKLVSLMKNMSFAITGTLGFGKSVIADGGVSLSDVNFKNMTSKIFPNLYLLGDVLHINRPSGGFSLQLCWTTGWVAGSDVGEKTNATSQT